jgi:hypothetical protein
MQTAPARPSDPAVSHGRLLVMTGPSDGIMSDENQATMARLRADQDWLTRQGVQLSQWGPDPVSDKVKVYLAHFTEDARDLLVELYGAAIVVSTEPRRWHFTGATS